MNNNPMLNIPNMLSLLRIALIPIFILIFYTSLPNKGLICALIFGLAGATDWLDGYLARKLNQTSKFGAFIDPVADKLIVAIALILLVVQQPTIWFVLPAIIIIGREIVVSALREWVAQVGSRGHLAVVTVAKYKTAAQMLAIFLLLLVPALSNTSQEVILVLGYVLLYIAAILTLWSMVTYLNLARKDF